MNDIFMAFLLSIESSSRAAITNSWKALTEDHGSCAPEDSTMQVETIFQYVLQQTLRFKASLLFILLTERSFMLHQKRL